MAGGACTSLRERREAAGGQGRPVLCGKGREVAGHHGRPELTGLSQLQREANSRSQFLSGIFSETVGRLLLILTTGTSGSAGKFPLPSGPVLSRSDLMIPSSATRRRLTTTRTVSSASSAASCLLKPSLRCHRLTWPGSHQACPFLRDTRRLPPSHDPVSVRPAHRRRSSPSAGDQGREQAKPRWSRASVSGHGVKHPGGEGASRPRGPRLRLPRSQNPNPAFSQGPESPVCKAKLWCVFFKERSRPKAFILKTKLFHLTKERVSGESEGSRQNLAHFLHSLLSQALDHRL